MSDNAQMRECAQEEQKPAVIADVIMQAIAEEERSSDQLRARVAALEALCGELYQVAGALDAPVVVLDALHAAASSEPLPDASLIGLDISNDIERDRAALRALVAELKRDLTHWKANHATEVRRARVLKDRPDMPLERVEAYDQIGEYLEALAKCRAAAFDGDEFETTAEWSDAMIDPAAVAPYVEKKVALLKDRVAELDAERAVNQPIGYIAEDSLRDLRAREPGAPPIFPMSSDRNHIPLYTAPPSTNPEQLTPEQIEKADEAIREALGLAYDCMRVWNAWSYGTMGPDDFWPVAESDERVAEIRNAAAAALGFNVEA